MRSTPAEGAAADGLNDRGRSDSESFNTEKTIPSQIVSPRTQRVAVNWLQEIDGGWTLLHRGKLAADVPYEAGGSMTSRPADELDAEIQRFYHAAEPIEWMYEPSMTPVWKPGFPESLIFAHADLCPLALGWR